MTLRRIQRRLQRREPPTDELIDGAMILLGAGLLITPRLLTDLTGFLLVIPVTLYPLRFALRRWVVGPWIRRKIESGDVAVEMGGSVGGWPGDDGERPDADVGDPGDDPVDLDDGAFDVVDDDDDP